MDGIAFGCVAALASARIPLSRRTLRIALIAGSVVACLVIVTCNEDSHTGLARFGLNVTLLEAGVALMLVALGGGVGNEAMARGTGWVRVIGRSSYEIYLVHMIVVLALMDLFKRLMPARSMIPLWYLAMLLLSLVTGYALRTTSSRWVGDADSQASSRDGVCRPEDPRSRVGSGVCALFPVWPR
jgi:peptidoglycan/LPS O-acetylase OafA/YrhL